MTHTDIVILVLLIMVASYFVGRYEKPKAPAAEQLQTGLQFITGQLWLLALAGALVLVVWMVWREAQG